MFSLWEHCIQLSREYWNIDDKPFCLDTTFRAIPSCRSIDGHPFYPFPIRAPQRVRSFMDATLTFAMSQQTRGFMNHRCENRMPSWITMYLSSKEWSIGALAHWVIGPLVNASTPNRWQWIMQFIKREKKRGNHKSREASSMDLLNKLRECKPILIFWIMDSGRLQFSMCMKNETKHKLYSMFHRVRTAETWSKTIQNS